MIRKPIFLLLALMSLFFGCTQKELDDTGISAPDTGDVPVTFLAAANSQTRGTSMSGTLNEDASFRVYATKQRKEGNDLVDQPSYYIRGTGDDDIVTYQRIAVTGAEQYRWVWKTARDYFWPQENYFVQFYAVHPASAPVIADILTDKSFTYGSSNPYDGNHDLMWATAATTRESAGNGSFKDPNDKTNSTVKLQFHHALAQISFYGKLSTQFKNWGWTVEVGGITICNINGGGTGTFQPQQHATALDPDNLIFTKADPAVLCNYTMSMNTGHLIVNETTVAKDDNNNDIPLTSPTDVTMVIPQKPTGWNPATETTGTETPVTEGCYLAIQMKIYDAQNYYQLGSADRYDTVFVPFETGVYYMYDPIAWQADTKYRYTLEFGGGYNAAGEEVIQPMTITTAIQPWDSTTIDSEAKH